MDWPEHVIISILEKTTNNYLDIAELEILNSCPAFALVSKRIYNLYWNYFVKNQQYLIYLSRMGVYPLFKNIFNNHHEVIWYLKEQTKLFNAYDSLPSRYPMDHYLIIRLQNHPILQLADLVQEHGDRYYVLDLIKDIIIRFKSKNKVFLHNGVHNYYLDLYQLTPKILMG
jgi:hypothetical protein